MKFAEAARAQPGAAVDPQANLVRTGRADLSLQGREFASGNASMRGLLEHLPIDRGDESAPLASRRARDCGRPAAAFKDFDCGDRRVAKPDSVRSLAARGAAQCVLHSLVARSRRLPGAAPAGRARRSGFRVRAAAAATTAGRRRQGKRASRGARHEGRTADARTGSGRGSGLRDFSRNFSAG